MTLTDRIDLALGVSRIVAYCNENGFIVGDGNPSGVPRPVVNSRMWAPAATIAIGSVTPNRAAPMPGIDVGMRLVDDHGVRIGSADPPEQIEIAANVGTLVEDFSFPTGMRGTHEGQPLVRVARVQRQIRRAGALDGQQQEKILVGREPVQLKSISIRAAAN